VFTPSLKAMWMVLLLPNFVLCIMSRTIHAVAVNRLRKKL
jgi:hypothetical protein